MSEPARTRTRFTDVDVQRMLDAGLLHDRRVELIDGDLIEMNPQGPVHANLTGWIHDLLVAAYGPTHHVRDHSPVDISPYDQPEPDVALVRGPRKKPAAHPRGTDVLLVVEIARTTVSEDRKKATVYARGGVPEYWIVDTERRRVEVHRALKDEIYTARQVLTDGDQLDLPERNDTIEVSQLLP